jgi:uncharacterized protein YcfJ
MKKIYVASLLMAVSTLGMAQEMGRVVSTTPIITQVIVPKQVCTTQTVQTQGQNTGLGGVTGLAVGAAIGNRFGKGDGRTGATLLGAVGGAIIGNQIEMNNSAPQTQNVQQCYTENQYENRTSGYNVVYEYAGFKYSVQLSNDPGRYIPLQVLPLNQSNVMRQAQPMNGNSNAW